MSLHVWHNGYDWVIAESVSDARELSGAEDDGDGWTQLDDDEMLTIIQDEPPTAACGCQERWQAHLESTRVASRLREHLAQQGHFMASLLVKDAPVRPDPKVWRHNGHLKSCPIGAETKSCKQWIEEQGRSFLCSTEF